MEPEGSLPHSQVPATCPYPKPHWPSSCPQIPHPEDAATNMNHKYYKQGAHTHTMNIARDQQSGDKERECFYSDEAPSSED